MSRRRVFFLGPLPPPVHGFSAINAKLVAALSRDAEVTVFNRAMRSSEVEGRGRKAVADLFSSLQLWFSFVGQLFVRRPEALYVGVSGGGGQWIDLVFVIFAKLFRVALVLHHHSFAYLNRPTTVSRILMRASREATQVVLCNVMGELLAAKYSLDTSLMYVLSNAAFVDHNDDRASAPRRVLRVGFLSNITEEKGIFDFLAVIGGLNANGLKIDARIAGPLADNVSDRFADELRRLPCATHVGPIYGEAKRRFLAELDILLFPTRYVNEAEPVTVFEAMSAGLVVFAAKRSCIDEMIAEDGGRVVDIDDFHRVVVENIIWLDADRESLFKAQCCAQKRFRMLSATSQVQLETLVLRWASRARPVASDSVNERTAP